MFNLKNTEPINKEIIAKNHTPQYRMHKYFARRPYNVFSGLIEHYSDENDLVLDVFCGGGVTVFESLALKRNTIGIDLNPVAAFITKMQLFNGDFKVLIKEFENFIDIVEKSHKNLYNINLQNDKGILDWVEWVYVVKCPECNTSIELSENNKIRNGVYKCTNKGCLNQKGVSRTKCFPNGSVPTRVKYTSNNGEKVLLVLDENQKLIILNHENSLKLEAGLIYPSFKIPKNWDRQLEDKLIEKGILEYKDFFTNKNFYVLTHVFNYIYQNKNNYFYKDELFFLFSSSLRYCNKMSRVTENWENGKPTAMDKHAFWLPNEYIESNVIEVLKSRYKAILKGFKFSKEKLPKRIDEVSLDYFNSDFDRANPVYSVLNISSSRISINDKRVDVIITDPPYGSNVQYSELSVIWNAWYQLYFNKDFYIYKEEEAVSNRKKNFEGSKSERDYEDILTRVFLECHRVLKDNGNLIFTFNNKNFNVWLAMLKSVTKAGFSLHPNGVLFQDFVESYKNTSHLRYRGNIVGDFIYTFNKKIDLCDKVLFEKPIQNVIEDKVVELLSKLEESDKLTTSDLYKSVFSSITKHLSDYIAFCFNSGVEDNLDSSFEDDYIDKLVKKYLNFDGQHWVVRQ